MSWLDRFRRNRPEVKVYPRVMRELKSFPLYQLIPSGFGYSAKWSQYTTAQALDAYRKSVWLYDCLRLRADNISGVPWVVEVKKGEDWEPAPNHPLTDLLANPNPCYDLPTMMAYIMYWLDLTGDAWGTKVRNGAGRVAEWWPLLPDSMEAVQGLDKMVETWKYRYNGKSKNFPARDIMHFRYVDPSSPYYGLSPLQAAAKSVDVDLEASNFQKVELQNHGVPVGYFQGPEDMTQEQYEQNQKWFSEQAGPERSRKPWLGSMTYQSMGNTPHELDFIDSRKMTRVEICSAYAVPPPLVGIYDDATLANIQTARRIFWMEGLIPILRKLEGQLTAQLASEYGPGVRITYDLGNVEALEQDQGEKITRAKELWNMGMPFDRINSFLELGFDAEGVDGADVGYLPSGLLPANFDTEEPEQGGEDAAAVTYGAAAEPMDAGAVPTEPVANTALNGAQVAALQGIIQSVADGMMPAASALQLILVSFPAISEQQARAMIGPLEGFVQDKPEPPPAPTLGEGDNG